MAYERYEAEDEDGIQFRPESADDVKIMAYNAETDRLAVLLEITKSGLCAGIGTNGASVYAEKRLCEMLKKDQSIDG